MAAKPECPECGSLDTWKRGTQIRNRKKVQRYQCNSCYRVFNEPKKDTKVQNEDT